MDMSDLTPSIVALNIPKSTTRTATTTTAIGKMTTTATRDPYLNDKGDQTYKNDGKATP
jgi:hypothetical protein